MDEGSSRFAIPLLGIPPIATGSEAANSLMWTGRYGLPTARPSRWLGRSRRSVSLTLKLHISGPGEGETRDDVEEI